MDLRRKALCYFCSPAGRCLWIVQGLSSTTPTHARPTHSKTFLQFNLSDVASIILSIIAVLTRDLRNLFSINSNEGVFYSCVVSGKKI